MSPLRILIPATVIATVLVLAGCASAPPELLAARECKVAVADFAGKPSKNVTRAEQAEAEMRVSRLALARGGYAARPNLAAEISRDCD